MQRYIQILRFTNVYSIIQTRGFTGDPKYIEIFNKLWEHSENEVVEFKKAETNFDIDELGKYFSALSNEANLRDHEFAWIVFGVWDKKRIKKIYTEQRNRFFPMPDYDIDNEHRTVGVTIYGKMIDEKYTNLLKANNSLSLKECLWLDAVQKHHPITKEAAKHLHEKGLIEGRAPHYTISLKVAKMTKQIGHYTKENGLAENSIQKLLLQLAHNAGSMGFKRQDVYEGLQHVFPSSLTQDEKLRKIGNLLRKIAKEGFITKTISGKQWIITEKGEQELNY